MHYLARAPRPHGVAGRTGGTEFRVLVLSMRWPRACGSADVAAGSMIVSVKTHWKPGPSRSSSSATCRGAHPEGGWGRPGEGVNLYELKGVWGLGFSIYGVSGC